MKSRIKIMTLMLAFIFITSSLCGCTASPATETAAAAPTNAPTEVAAPTETTVPTVAITETPATHTVTDMAGRTVTLPTDVKCVGTFGSIRVLHTFVETMGQGSKICNEGSAGFTKSKSWAIYQYLFAPQLKDSPIFQNADGEIMMENVLAANPDVSLTMTKELTDQLASQGLNVIYLSWRKLEDVKPAVTLLGEVLNTPDVAKDYLAYFDEKIAWAAELTKDIKEEDKKTVLYGSISSFSQPHIIAEWYIPTAGGISVTGAVDRGEKESITYTMEDVLKWNPDVMIVGSNAEKEKVLADPILANADVTAVKEKQIFVMPTVGHAWGNRTTEQPLTVMFIMNKLYPDIMTDEMLAKEIFYFYSHFFKVDFTDQQIEDIIYYKL